MVNKEKIQSGFTLIELLMVIGIFGILVMVATVNMIKPQVSASIYNATSTLMADIKQQQLKAMLGDTQGETSSQAFGVYFETNQYTLFNGTSYNAGDPNNFVISLQDGMIITNINFPSSQVVFSKRSGEISEYLLGSDNITIRHDSAGEEKTITTNKYGALTLN
jgi:prepilin-type N-terminal cleavage/methylation domain-containing protein